MPKINPAFGGAAFRGKKSLVGADDFDVYDSGQSGDDFDVYRPGGQAGADDFDVYTAGRAPDDAPPAAEARVAKPSPLDQSLYDAAPGHEGVERFLTMDVIRDVPKLFGQGGSAWTGGDGSAQQQRLSEAARTQGTPLAAVPGETVAGNLWSGSTQFAANVLAGVAGTVAAPAALTYTLGANIAREVSEGAARAVLPYWLPKDLIERPWFKKALESGELSAGAHGRRLVSRSKEFGRAFVAGLSPALTALVTAKEGERSEKFWEAMYMYPVESILPIWTMGVKPTMVRSLPMAHKLGRAGKAFSDARPLVESVDIKKAGIQRAKLEQLIEARKSGGLSERAKRAAESLPEELGESDLSFGVRTMRGKELRLNDAGLYAWSKTPDFLKPYIWDAEPSNKALPRILNDYAIERTEFQKVHEADVKEMLKARGEDIRNEVESLEQAFYETNGVPARTSDIISALELTESLKEGATKKRVQRIKGVDVSYETVASSKEITGAWAKAHKSLINSDLSDTDAAMVASVAIRTMVEHTRSANRRSRQVPEQIPTFSELLPEKVKASQAGIVAAMDEFASKVMGEPEVASALKMEAYRLKDSPQWVHYMERMRSTVRGDNRFAPFRWDPTHRIQTRIGEERLGEFREAVSSAEKMISEKLAEEGESASYFPVTDHGALMHTVPYKTWKSLIKSKGERSPIAEAKVLALLAMDPIVRIRASKDASPFAKRVAEVLGRPEHGLHQFRRTIQRVSYDAAKNLGISPFLVAKKWDSYLSRMFRDAAETEARLFEDLAGAYVGKYLSQGTRIARRLSRKKSDQWLSDLSQKGVIDISRVVMNTATQTAAMADLMSYYSDLKDSLVSAGLAMEPVSTKHSRSTRPPNVPGWEQIAVTKVKGEGGQPAASSNPYNFLFGKLAGLYVHPTVAKRLRLTRRAMKSGNGLLTSWKLLHTIYNPPGYPIRNHIGDFVNIIAATGINPWLPWNRKHLKRFHNSFKESSLRSLKPNTPMTKRWLSALELGVVSDVSQVADVGGLAGKMNSAARQIGYMLARSDVEQKSVIDSLSLPSMRLMQLQSMGRVAKRFFPKNMAGQLKKVRKQIDDLRAEWQAEEMKELGLAEKAVYTWVLGSEKLKEFNTWLGNNALAGWNVDLENSRRFYLFQHAMDDMGLKPGEAANFVKTVLHDYGDKPEWLERAQKHKIVGLVLPPFLTYGYKQALYGTKRAMNDPHLPVMAALVKGMVAWNMQANQEETKSNQDYMAMMHLSSNTSWGNDRWLLGNNKKWAESFQSLGVNKHLVEATRAGNLTMTLPFRDLFNLNTMLSDVRPTSDPLEQLARAAPFFDMAHVVVDRHGRSLAQRSIGNPASTEGHTKLQRTLTFIASNFTPFSVWRQLRTAGLAAHTVATGKTHRSKAGTAISPIEILRPIIPATPISPIDQANVILRIERGMKGEIASFNRDAATHKKGFNIHDEDDRLLLSRNEIEYEFRRAEIQLVAARRISGPDAVPSSVFIELRKNKNKALKRFDKRHAISTRGALPGKSGNIVRALQRVVSRVMDGD